MWMRSPGKRVVRGLGWVLKTAHADWETVADEKGTGHFAGTSAKEAAEALEWLEELVRSFPKDK